MPNRGRSEELLEAICRSIQAGSQYGKIDGGVLYELPITYLDGSHIELLIREDGKITDDGRTLIRIGADSRMGEIEDWDDLAWFKQHYKIEFDGPELRFSGQLEDIVHFIQGLRDFEVKLPRTRERSQNFDTLVKRAMERVVDEAVGRGALSRDVAEYVLNPTYSVRVPREDSEEKVEVEIEADFWNHDKSELVVILSHGGESTTDRLKHIRSRLATHSLLRVNGNGRGGSREEIVRSLAVAPKNSEYGQQERDLIAALTGRAPLMITEQEVPRKLAPQLIGHGPFR